MAPQNQPSRPHRSSEVATINFVWICTRTYAYMHTMVFQLGVLVELLAMGVRVSLTHLPACAFFSFCVALSIFNIKVYAQSYYFLLCQIWLISLKSCYFLKGYEGAIDLEKRECWRGIGRRKEKKGSSTIDDNLLLQNRRHSFI